EDPTYLRANERRGKLKKGAIRRAQYQPDVNDSGPELRSVQLTAPAGGLRRVQIFPRTGGTLDIDSFPSTDTTPPQQIVVFTGGVNVLVDGIDQRAGDQPIGTIDLSADRVVLWTDTASGRSLQAGAATQERDLPLQVYLEGNIVIRQGANVLRARQAFY